MVMMCWLRVVDGSDKYHSMELTGRDAIATEWSFIGEVTDEVWFGRVDDRRFPRAHVGCAGAVSQDILHLPIGSELLGPPQVLV